MNRSIFDSEAEKKLYRKLKSRWSKYVEIYPQIPTRNVIGYHEIKSLDLPKKAIDYLLNTAFDIVVCELQTAVPILVIEFDGIGGGFSQDGQYISKIVPLNDPYRKLKIERKLEACLFSNVPLAVLSFAECEFLNQRSDMLMVIDAIIGQALECQYYKKNYAEHSKALTEALRFGGKEAAEMYTIEMDVMAEQMNPIKKKINELTNKFPFWTKQIVFPRKKDDDHVEGRFFLRSGSKIVDGKFKQKVLLFVDISMRDVNFAGCDTWQIFNSIGEYCLARKVETTIGFDRESWERAIQQAQWTGTSSNDN
ncbi:DUF2726 domain-containing protein [bacterium]|jgi:hypothetical protein|nr:DUF2726 domain-containing protein [bacterium]